MISQHPLRCWIVVGRHSTYGNINRSVGGHLMLHTVVPQDSHEALESEKFLEDEALSLGARRYHERQDRKAAQEGFDRSAERSVGEECVRQCKERCAQRSYKKKTDIEQGRK